MCGICGRGIFKPSAQIEPLSLEQMQSMASVLSHRGPDSDGFYISPTKQIGLGFRRLSIIDLSSGDQPISNEDGTIWIVFNGEIYNFRELRRELESKGHIFRTQSDTEAIVHAYEEYGDDFLLKLRGMFAFAIWDQRNRRLLLARDRLGKKPLFYHLSNGAISFASELKSLLCLKETPRDLDIEALDLFLTYGYIGAPLSILQGVNKLPPAHFLVLDFNSYHTQIESYWNLSYLPKLEISFDEAAEELRSIMNEAVRLRMISDVPLGALLSGGVDSSSIVALMAQHSEKPIKTFTIGFNEQQHDERAFARLVSEQYGTEHHEMIVTPNAVDILSKLVWYLDEPMADSSVIPTYYVASMARQYVTVVLNGDGGDESFAGYRSYRSILRYKQYRDLPDWQRKKVVEFALSAIPQSLYKSIAPLSRLNQMVERSYLPLAQQFEVWETISADSIRQFLYLPDYRRKTIVREGYLGQIIQNSKDLDILDRLLRADILAYLPGDLLVKMDRMAMAHSLEARSPFLDQNVVEFAARLPVDYKFHHGVSKRLIRHAFGKLIPEPLLKRSKSGFSIPLADWLRRDLRPRFEQLIADPNGLPDIFDRRALRKTWDDFLISRNDSHAKLLWALIILGEWKQNVLK